MNQEKILAVLSHSEAEAKSLREIAQTMELETSSYASWIQAERGLSSTLRKLIKWGLVACAIRQNVNGQVVCRIFCKIDGPVIPQVNPYPWINTF